MNFNTFYDVNDNVVKKLKSYKKFRQMSFRESIKIKREQKTQQQQ